MENVMVERGRYFKEVGLSLAEFRKRLIVHRLASPQLIDIQRIEREKSLSHESRRVELTNHEHDKIREAQEELRRLKEPLEKAIYFLEKFQHTL